MKKEQTTINDIAKKAGVSIATVSRVINNNGNVNIRTKRRVEEVMSAEGYLPNLLAQGMSKGKTKTVGIIAPVLINAVHSQYISVLEYHLRENEFNTLLISNTGYDSDKTPFLQEMLSRMVDAIILIGCSMEECEDPNAFSVAASRVPVVIINGYSSSQNVYGFYCDEKGAIYSIVSALLNAGKRRVLYIYDTSTFSSHQKLTGYRDALISAGIKEDTDLIWRHFAESDMRPTARVGAREIVNKVLEKGTGFDAVVAADDILAAGVIEALRSHGIQPGDDIPVIGFNNSSVSECTYPKLTTVDGLVEDMCALAVSHLMDILAGKTGIKKIVTPCKIIERASTKKILHGVSLE